MKQKPKKEELRSWLNNAINKGATHVMIVEDTEEIVPVHSYSTKGNTLKELMTAYKKLSGFKITAVYDLNKDIEKQLKEINPMNI